ncbi:MAG: ABC transporter substrate-binding protein [Clostridia bacterium]|nr:ABC transporter substrate-binding protein [Clostridia bacterium]
MKSTIKQAKQLKRRLFLSHKTISILALLFAVIMLFSSCDETVITTDSPTSPDKNTYIPVSSEHLNIGYSKADSLNPFFMTTGINNDLVSLVFEPLFYLDDSFCARNGLAASYSVQDNVLTVKLDTSAAFSDGVQFSSTDVLYSYEKAKASQNYKSELSGILSVSATAADTVVFTLSSPCINAVDSLTFPIVKSATAENTAYIPIGTGLYSYVVSETEARLDYNPYCRKPQPNIAKVKLVPITPASTLLHTLELGTIDAYFDDFSQGSYSQANAASTKTNLSNLVFLGMNSNSYGLNSAEVRQAVYFAINRQAVVKNSFKKYAVASAVPYHPEWHVLEESDYDISFLNLDYSSSQTLLTQAGIAGTLIYNLIVYSGNNFKVAAAKEIQASLKNIGINVIIKELTWDEYNSALTDNAYDLYIGEIKLPTNMNLSTLFSSSGPVKGVSPADTTYSAYEEFSAGKITIDAFTQSFLQNMPFAPICFRTGALIYSNDITPAADCDTGNAYKNVYEWEIHKTGES